MAVMVSLVGILASPLGAAQQSKDSKTLTHAVSQINNELQEKYGVLDPTPLTVARVRDAIEQAIEKIADSDLADRIAIVEKLQTILSSGNFPEDIDFRLTAITGNYKEGSPLGDRMISLNYTLQVPTPHADTDYRLLGLTQLAEGFRIERVEMKKGESESSEASK